MSKGKKNMTENPAVPIGGIVFALLILVAGAYYLGQRQAVDNAEAKHEPVQKFRAKEGTERKNAKALTSSQRSKEEALGEGTQKEWGSLERPDKNTVATRSERAVQDAVSAETPEEGIRVLLKRLSIMGGNEQRSMVYMALSQLYRALDPPMLDESEKALGLAWEYAQTVPEKLEATYFQASFNLAQGDYQGLLETVSRIDGESLPATSHSLELGVMVGIAYEKTGNTENAKISYTGILEQARSIGLEQNVNIANVYRQAGMNLAMLLRREGNEQEAQVLARRVQTELAF